MMPMMKHLRLALAIPLVFAATAMAEDTKIDGGKLVGTWEAVKGSETLPLGSTLEFSKEGKLKLTIKQADESKVLAGSYKVEGATIKITLKVEGMENSETLKVTKLSDKDLVIVDEKDKKDVLSRKK
jgi:uncharacterized protein (TIGR03066 family)